MEDQKDNQEFKQETNNSPQQPERGGTEPVREAEPAPKSAPTEAERQFPSRQPGRGRDRHGRPQNQHRRPQNPERQQEGGKEVSIVIPLYNEEQSLRELFENIRNALGRNSKFEVMFVDDGSTDGSMRVLHELRSRDRRIKIVRFRRNYGKSAALDVGFANAKGDIIVTMDADLQDDPNEIPNLINELRKGSDMVSGWKKKRRDPITKTLPSKFFNFVVSRMTGIKLHDFNCGLKAYKKDVIKELNIYGELHRFIPVLAHWKGFKVTEIAVQHYARKYGKTKYGFGRFWKGFLDLITTLFTTRYMERPLHLFGFWGMIFFLLGFGIDLYLGILKFTEGMALSNRPLFVGGILLIIVGVQFISIGLLGELITKTHQKTEKEYSIREIWK